MTTVAYSAESLEPAPSAVQAAANKQHYDENDEESCGVHIVLLLGDKRGPPGRIFLKAKTGHSQFQVRPPRVKTRGGVGNVPRLLRPLPTA